MGKWKTQINVKVVDSEGRLQPNHNITLRVTKIGTDLMSTDTDMLTYSPVSYTASTTSAAMAQFTIPSQNNKVPRAFYVKDETWNSESVSYNINVYSYNVSDNENQTAVVMPNPITYTVANKTSTGSSKYYYSVRTLVNGTAVGNIALTAGTLYLTTSNLSWSKGIADFTATTSTVIVQAKGTYNGTTYYGNSTVTGSLNGTPSSPTDISLNTGSTLERYYNRIYTVNVRSKYNSVGISDATVQLGRITRVLFPDGTSATTIVSVSNGYTNSAGTYTTTMRLSQTELLSKSPTDYFVSKNGYVTESGSLETLSSNSSTTVVYLYEAVNIYGKCYDATTTNPLSGVTMNIKYDSADTSTYETVATSDENGYYSATLGLGRSFYRCVFAKNGYYAEDNILMSGRTSFWESMQWDHIFWQSLPTDVNKSIMYKEWLIANHGGNFEKLSEDRFQVVPSANIKKVATMATFNGYADKQGVPKTVSFDDGNGVTFWVDTDMVNTNGWNGKNFAIANKNSDAKYYTLSSLKESYFIPAREYVGSSFTISSSGKTSTVAVTSKGSLGTRDVSGFFIGYTNIEQINMPDAFYGVLSYKNFANGCQSLEYVNIPNTDLLPNISANTTNIQGMFYNCTSLRKVNMSGVVPRTNTGYMMELFYNCKSIEEIDLSYNVMSARTNATMFTNCISLKKIQVDGWDDDYIKYLQMQLNYARINATLTTGSSTYLTTSYNGTVYTVNFIVKFYNTDASGYGLQPFEGDCDFRVYEYSSSAATDTGTCTQRRRTHGEPSASIKVLPNTKVTFAIPEMPSGYACYVDGKGVYNEGGPVEKGVQTVVITKNTDVIIKLTNY